MSIYNYFAGPIRSLYPDEIFVFGSNLSGVHGSGAARQAMDEFGAVYGHGVGYTGQCYAIPSKDKNIKTMPVSSIKPYVDQFKEDALRAKGTIFLVTRIGCGLAGYTNEEIAPMFIGAPKNCWFDLEWREYLETV